MKKLFVVPLLLASAAIAQADTRLVNADGSALSAICIAATGSREAMQRKAAELGVRDFNPGELRCNGRTLARFVAMYRKAPRTHAVAYVFSKSDDTAVTELCLAAVRSEQDYVSVKERLFGNDATVEAEVRCNGMPLQSFARRYRAPVPALSSR